MSHKIIKKVIDNKVFRNFSYLTIGSLLSQLIGIFTIIKITKLFSPNDYGVYTFIMSQGTLLFIIADLGITNIIIRTISRDKHRTNDLIFNGAIIRFFSVLCLALFYVIYNYLLGSLTASQLLLVSLFALINCFAHLFEIAFLGNQEMLPTSLINLSYSVIWFSIVYILPSKFINVNLLFSIFLILNALKAVASFIILKYKKLLIGKVQNFWISLKGLLGESWPYFSLVLVMIPVNYLSNNFLETNSNFVQVGYFNLAQKLMLPVNFVLGFALSAIFPNLAALWDKDEKRFYRLVSAGFKYFMLAALILCFLFTLFAREIITLLFNKSYLPAVDVCQLQVWFVFLMAINSLVGTIFGAVNKEKLILKLGIVNALISTPMLYIGSKYGALGISYGYVISFAIFEFYLWYIFKKSVKVNIQYDLLLWIFALVLFLISYFIPQNLYFFYRVVLAAAVVGFTSLYFLEHSSQYN